MFQRADQSKFDQFLTQLRKTLIIKTYVRGAYQLGKMSRKHQVKSKNWQLSRLEKLKGVTVGRSDYKYYKKHLLQTRLENFRNKDKVVMP